MAVLAHQEAQSSDSRHRHEARDPTKESAAVVKTADALDEHSLLNPEPARVFLVWTHRRPRGGKRLHASVATLYYCVATWAEECELLTHAADSGVGEQGADAGEIHEQLNFKRCAEDGGAHGAGLPARARVLRQRIESGQLQAASSPVPSSAGRGVVSGRPYCLRADSTRRPDGACGSTRARACPGGGVGRGQCHRASGRLRPLCRPAAAPPEEAARSG